MKNQKVLITGGFGYVGSRLTPHLLEKGYDVRVLDLNLYGDYGLNYVNETFSNDVLSRFSFVKGDIRNPEDVNKALEGRDAVIHLAAISNDPTGEIDETLTRQVNFDAVGLLVTAAKRAGVKRYISASSSSVFGVKEEENINEQLQPEPITAYSRFKMLSEWIVNGASSEDFCTVNIRPATICGFSPRQRFDLTVNKLTADAISKKVITVHGGQQRRPNVGMTDMIHLYESMLQAEDSQINGKTFNFGFENLKVIEIAEVIQKQLEDLGVEINVTETKDRRDYHISSDKILRNLNYEPVSSIRNEVGLLREKLDSGAYGDIDAPQYYNMKSMELKQTNDIYPFMGKNW